MALLNKNIKLDGWYCPNCSSYHNDISIYDFDYYESTKCRCGCQSYDGLVVVNAGPFFNNSKDFLVVQKKLKKFSEFMDSKTPKEVVKRQVESDENNFFISNDTGIVARLYNFCCYATATFFILTLSVMALAATLAVNAIILWMDYGLYCRLSM